MHATHGACHHPACICTPVSMQVCATMHISASHSSSRRVSRCPCSHMQVHVQSFAHSHGFVHASASLPSLGTCSHRATCWSLGSPQGLCHPAREQSTNNWTRIHAHMCTQACCHPSCSRAKSSPTAGGLPRCSCWVTARSNDAMSSFAYAKQHLCCRVPREEALLPAPRDPAGMPKDANASSMHIFPALPWPHTLAWACFINSYYVR